MRTSMSRRPVFMIVAVVLMLFVVVPLASGQSRLQPSGSSGSGGFPDQGQGLRERRAADALGVLDRTAFDVDLARLPSGNCPIIVYPGGVGFDSLQDALDFCGAEQRGLSSSSRASTVVLQPNTHLTGNWVLPTSGIRIVGVGGKMSTSLSGAPGVNAPVVRFAPNTGSNRSSCWIRGVWFLGREVAAVEYASSDSYATLWLEDCQLETDKNIPAIKMSGSGYNIDGKMDLSLVSCDIESEGAGVACSIGACVSAFVGYESEISAKTKCFEVVALLQLANEFTFYRSVLFGEGTGIEATNLSRLWIGSSIVNTDQTALQLTNVGDFGFEQGQSLSLLSDAWILSNVPRAKVQYSQISAEAAGCYGVKLLNGSTGRLSFISFYTDVKANAVYIDGLSSLFNVYNQWHEEPWP